MKTKTLQLFFLAGALVWFFLATTAASHTMQHFDLVMAGLHLGLFVAKLK